MKLSFGEEVSWIGHFAKLDKVYFASHEKDFSQVYVKELQLIDNSYRRQSGAKDNSIAGQMQEATRATIAGLH